MAKKIICDSNNQFLWGKGNVGWHLIDNQSLSVIREVMLPNTEEVKHYHQHSQQLFYIIKGKATFEVENETVEVDSGESLIIEAGEKHQIFNKTEQELVFLVISMPSTVNDRFDVSNYETL